MRHWPALIALGIATPVIAAPPPPPPAYVTIAANALVSPDHRDVSKITSMLADDVTVIENGSILGNARKRWNALSKSINQGRVLGYSEGWDDLLVVDTYDTVDHSKVGQHEFIDARMATRSIFYQFGEDQRIHVISISQTNSFWIKPETN